MAHHPKTASSAADFKRNRQESAAAHPLLLPSGLTILVRRPSPMWFVLHRSLPQSLAAKQSAGSSQEELKNSLTVDDVVNLTMWTVELLKATAVAPKISMQPTVDELSPEDLDQADLDAIIKWTTGEVTEVEGADGTSVAADLGEFRQEQKPAESRIVRRDVEHEAEHDAGGRGSHSRVSD